MKKRYKNSNYYIYDDGRCYSELSNKFLTPQMSSKYPTYNLTIGGVKKKTKVHRMVAETFLEPVQDKNYVNHIDGDTHNFHLSNLEWVTEKENAQHAVINGLKPSTNQNGVYLTPELKLDNEKWVEIQEYSNYLISNYGRVLNKNTNRLLKSCLGNNGYWEVNLWKNNKGKTFQIHRLVYINFTNDNNLQGYVINHIDGNKLNNNLKNLEKITYSQNNLHAEYIIKTHQCAKAVIQLNEDKTKIIAEFISIAEAQRKTNIGNISRAIKTGYKAGGYYWEFKESD